MRPLKFHEQKLLKKVDMLSFQKEDNLRQSKVMSAYGLNQQEYTAYNKIVGMISSLIVKLKALPADNQFRIAATESLIQKLYSLGLVPSQHSALPIQPIPAAALARRRLPIVLLRKKMATTLPMAIEYVKHGHIRVGPEVVTDPAFIVTRSVEDYITWVDSSKIKRTIAQYNDKLDDYELLGE